MYVYTDWRFGGMINYEAEQSLKPMEIKEEIESNIQLSYPNPMDGIAVHSLIEQCPPLDTNSLYCNLLQCSHFANTSIIAKKGEEIAGFVSAYLIPKRPDTIFIWQVVVAKSGRGKGLALKMIQQILERPACENVSLLETTVTPSNKPSINLFKKLAEILNANITQSTLFDKNNHFNGHHDTEELFRIGPFSITSNNKKL